MPWLRPGLPVGLYASVGSEVGTGALTRLARSRGCPIYLPRIVDYRARGMLFARLRSRASAVNRYGIPEPSARETVPARALSVVFVPVLGFDRRGTRLGSGAGFYDRLFSFRRTHAGSPPLLIGLAYACQELPYIEPSTHDVPLDAVITEQRVVIFSKSPLRGRPAPPIH
jgi:5-formyltetrahydrofolate cyclo-ligase